MSYCTAPFKGIYVNNNRVRPCCWFDRSGVTNHIDNLIDAVNVFESEEYDTLRHSEPQACWKCRMHEEKGGSSHRTLWNSRYEDDGIARIEMLDLYLGNLCNIACVMCSSNNSTKWIREEQLLFGKAFRNYQEDIDLQLNYDLVKDLKRIKLAGGEPLIIPQVKDLMQQLIDLGVAPNIKLSIITNNTQDPRQFKAFFDHFKSVEFILSIEGVGDVNDYVRYGSKWDTVNANVQHAIDMGIEVSINCVVSILNVYHLPQLIEWWGHRSRVLYRILDYPKHLSILNLTPNERMITLKRLEGYDELEHICETLMCQEESHRDTFDTWIRTLDNHRGNSFYDINPQFKP